MKRCLLLVAAIALLIRPATAMFMIPPQAPVDRLIKNVTAYTKEHPKEANGFYTLGRVHFLAFSLKATSLGVYQAGDEAGKNLPRLADMQIGRRRPAMPPRPDVEGTKPDEKEVPLTDEQVIDHLKAAVENYRKAVAMDDKNGLYQLGMACALEKGAALAEKVGAIPGDSPEGKKPTPEQTKATAALSERLIKQLGADAVKTRDAASKELRAHVTAAMPYLLKHTNDEDAEIKARVATLIEGYWKERSVAYYLAAYKLAITKDLEIKYKPLQGLNSLVSYEAGQSYIRLVTHTPPARTDGRLTRPDELAPEALEGLTEEQKKQVAKIQEDLKTLQNKGQGPVTPIVFSLDRPAALGDLIDPRAAVKFNLDGTGRPQAWQWVKPATGILVWDPKGTGNVTSGWQLFGTVSFFMFWEDGYRAMDALDDNRDGKLEGAELRGLGVWFDRNSDGRAGPGEVVAIEKTGIRSISVRATGKSGDSPCNSAGLTMQDGRTLPTYDWVARPIKQAP